MSGPALREAVGYCPYPPPLLDARPVSELPPPPTLPAVDLSAYPDPLAPGVPLLQRFARLWVMARVTVDVRVAVLMMFCGGWLVFTQLHCTVSGFDRDIRPLLGQWRPYLYPMLGHLYWFWMGPLVLCLIPLGLGCSVLKVRPAELGFGVGTWRSGIKWVAGIYACFLPVVVAASFFPSFKNMYPMNHFAGDEMLRWLTDKGGSPWPFLFYEFSYGMYFVGWEFFFRGFVGFSLFRAIGWYGVFVATIPFAVMHVGKPEAEAMGSVVAGVALGVFALKERSFLYGAALHMLVAWSMDILAILHKWRAATGK